MGEVLLKRPGKDEYYLNIAAEVAKRSTCLRRHFGAVIVRDDQIISTGYNGAPRGSINCIDLNDCPRQRAGIPPGERYELCRSVHAEMNAIIHASRQDMLDSTLYVACIDPHTGERINGIKPCKLCTRMIINAGIAWVVTGAGDGRIQRYSVAKFVEEDRAEWTPENMAGY
ncbi:MAG: dCMP deaminase family protein [Firmicutes bacterium]|nr:dCMP deaminase family protein [Bacillota bacterium]